MIINSILDNDFYKFTMQNAVISHFPYADVQYRFINRGNHKFPKGFAMRLREEVDRMATLKLTDDEYDYLQDNFKFLDPTYLDFLKGFRYNPNEVLISQNEGELELQIEGKWYRTVLWETPLMALISELFYKTQDIQPKTEDEIAEIAHEKMKFYANNQWNIAEFGTRRRFSYRIHEIVLNELINTGGKYFNGTSNVHLSHKYKTPAIGTHAHEWFMFHAARYGFRMANHVALENWVDVYRGDLGIALSDTYTSEIFFESFDKKFSKLFDGVRHDSGDPLRFIDLTVEHYKRNNIDPLTKTIIFSDGLSPEKVKKIASYAQGKIKYSFGIGTNFTNDAGPEKMNFVIKLYKAKPSSNNWVDTIKLSDEKIKHSGSKEMIDLAIRSLSAQFDHDVEG